MSYTVHKLALVPTGIHTVLMPLTFEMLHCDYQHGKVAFWYRCAENPPMEERVLAFVGTGGAAPGPDEAEHIGTVLLHNGSLVLHAFLKKR